MGAYTVYEGGTTSKMALFNCIDDTPGVSDTTVSIRCRMQWGEGNEHGADEGNEYRYLSAPSISFKNIIWAGQSLSSKYKVDGHLKGDLNIFTITFNQAVNACRATQTFAMIDLKVPETSNGRSERIG
ncbi:hypothetical protein BDQ12DRAFT_725913 [Crucibulum laeve]|uniref:Beta-glucuronidase C-terminal domain-containing protein n=1 Tax=Crucibulum laeve TaxID=68775 RepID=A0A5C3LTB2_9AGAR|nr:hypothetical protein BDQ12DRAFT_725913 [Crucibulum laeve]